MSDARFASLEREVENLKARVLELERARGSVEPEPSDWCLKSNPTHPATFCARRKGHEGLCGWAIP